MSQTDKNKENLEKAEAAFEKDFGEGSIKELEKYKEDKAFKIEQKQKEKNRLEVETAKALRAKEEEQRKADIEKNNQAVALRNFQEEHYDNARTEWSMDKLKNDKRIKDLIKSGKTSKEEVLDYLNSTFDKLVKTGKIEYKAPTETPVDYKDMGEQVNLDKRTLVKGATSNWNRIFRQLANSDTKYSKSEYIKNNVEVDNDASDAADKVVSAIRNGANTADIKNKIADLIKNYPNLLGDKNYPLKREEDKQSNPVKKERKHISIK